MSIKKVSIMIAVLLTAFMFSACGSSGGGGGNDDDEITGRVIAGKLSDEYLNKDVDTLWLVVTYGISSNSRDLLYFSYPVNSDGSFKIDFGALLDDFAANGWVPENWAMLLINSKAETRKEKIIGFMGISDILNSKIGLGGLNGIQAVLIDVPIGKANDNGIQLGLITPASEDGIIAGSDSSIDDIAGSFDMSTDIIKDRSRTDNFIKTIKNNYISSEYDVYAYLRYGLKYDISNIKTGNEWSKPEILPADYIGYSIGVEDRSPESIFTEALVQSNSTEIRLYPPGNITYFHDSTSTTYGINAPLTSEDTPGFSMYPQDGGSIYYELLGNDHSTQYVSGMPPKGYWSFKALSGGVEKEYGTFDLSFTSIFDSSGKPNFYIPVLKFTTDSEGVISKVEIKLMFYKDGAYKDATDLDYAWYKTHFEMGLNGTTLIFKKDETSKEITGTPVNINSLTTFQVGCYYATYQIIMRWE